MATNEGLLDLYSSLRRNLSLEGTAALRDTGFGLRQYLILLTLSRRVRVTVSELVVCAMTDAATISRSLQQLAKAGYVEKLQCKADGRVYYVQLTKKGEAIVPELDRLHRQLADRCFSCLNSSEKDIFGSLLGRVVAHLEGSLGTPMAPAEESQTLTAQEA